MADEIVKAQFVEQRRDSASDLAHVENTVFTGIRPVQEEQQIAMFNAINEAYPLWDALEENTLPEVLEVINIIGHDTKLEDMNTGEEVNKVRVILVCADGNAYSSSSAAVFNAVKQIIAIKGTPDMWGAPVKVKAFKKKSRKGMYFMSLSLA